jgi:hypothetical protein
VVSTDPNLLNNSGVGVTLQAVQQTFPAGNNYMSVWVDDYLPNDLWLQVGYIQTNANSSATVYAVEEVWNLSTDVIVGSATGPTVPANGGYYTVAAEAVVGNTTWSFLFDGVQFATYSCALACSISLSTQQSHVLLEEQTTAPSPFAFATVSGQLFQYYRGGTWHFVASETSFGPYFGPDYGAISAYANDEFTIGDAGTTIWSG